MPQGTKLACMKYAAANGLFYQDITVSNMTNKLIHYVVEIDSINDKAIEDN